MTSNASKKVSFWVAAAAALLFGCASAPRLDVALKTSEIDDQIVEARLLSSNRRFGAAAQVLQQVGENAEQLAQPGVALRALLSECRFSLLARHLAEFSECAARLEERFRATRGADRYVSPVAVNTLVSLGRTAARENSRGLPVPVSVRRVLDISERSGR